MDGAREAMEMLTGEMFDTALGYLTWALRALEESAQAQRASPAEVTFFLGALNRVVNDEERGYIAMAFAARKEARDELTGMLEARLAVGRGAVIAGIDRHLRGAQGAGKGDTSASTTAHLNGLRQAVVAKASRLLRGRATRRS